MALENLQNLLQFNLRALLPLMLIALVVMGNILFAATSILPRWTTFESLTAQIDEQKAVLAARAAEGDDPEMIDVLHKQIDNARSNLDAASTIFLTEPQANQMLNQLFEYASDSGVEITNLQAQQADQSAPDREYDVRVFRLQIQGTSWPLISFVARIREGLAESLAIRGVDLKGTTDLATLTLEVLFYTSPYASGEALADLPEIPVPVAMTSQTAAAVEPPVEPVATPESGVEVTTVAYLAAPLPLNLLYVDTFDAGVLYAWEAGPLWSFQPEGVGQALEVTHSNAPMTFRYSTLQDAAVQARFKLDGGSARLSLRASEAGNYTAVLDPADHTVRLYRRDVLIQSAQLPDAPATNWHTLQLSAIEDIVRLVVDHVEYIAIRDLAQLPPGTASFSLVGMGTLRVDDFMLWTPRHADSPTEQDGPEGT